MSSALYVLLMIILGTVVYNLHLHPLVSAAVICIACIAIQVCSRPDPVE